MKIAVANMAVGHEKARNLKKMEELVGQAREHASDLLVFPEMALQGYADFAFPHGSKEAAEQLRYYLAEAEQIPGPSTDAMAALAKRVGMVIQFGLAEIDAARTTVYNSVAVVDPDGLRGTYRKVHNQFEHPYFAPGHAIKPITTSKGLIGPLICYDLAFPEVARRYALQGVRLLTMSTAWPMKGHDRATDYHGRMMDLSCRANAFFNQAVLACSNHCEAGAYSAGVDYYGGSQIVAATGDVAAMLATEEGVVAWECDLSAQVNEARTEPFFGLSLLADRRPECYRSPAGQDVGGQGMA
jgi:predicted amidohydrolase